jgi:hypothetical protein
MIEREGDLSVGALPGRAGGREGSLIGARKPLCPHFANPSSWTRDSVYLAKVGIRNLSPQLRNIANNQIDCAIPQLSVVSCQFSYFLVLFLSSGWF